MCVWVCIVQCVVRVCACVYGCVSVHVCANEVHFWCTNDKTFDKPSTHVPSYVCSKVYILQELNYFTVQ